jgi:uncharacterized protein DUF4837
MPKTTTSLAALGLFLSTLLAACDAPLAWGEWNSVIVAATPERWAEVEEMVDSALQPQIFTVRRENTFKVTYQDPYREGWGRLQRFKQLLLIGSEAEPWIRKALAESDRDSFSPPELIQVQDVWARGQLVTILLTDAGADVEQVRSQLEALHELLDGQYREWVTSRMFLTGRDTALADTLWREASFALVVPKVYYWRRDADSIFIFRNDNPDPSELIRQITVSWRTPIPESFGQEELLAWRQEISGLYFTYPQALDLSNARERRLQLGDLFVDELQVAWSNPPEDAFPAGGPLIVRSIECPAQDRLYLVDAWLYAPSKNKYEYMLQLETILNSFRCAPQASSAGSD